MEERLNRIITIGEAILKVLEQMESKQEIPYNRQQAAAYLGVSDTTIDNYRKRGLLTLKVQNGIRGYLRQDLDTLRK